MVGLIASVLLVLGSLSHGASAACAMLDGGSGNGCGNGSLTGGSGHGGMSRAADATGCSSSASENGGSGNGCGNGG